MESEVHNLGDARQVPSFRHFETAMKIQNMKNERLAEAALQTECDGHHLTCQRLSVKVLKFGSGGSNAEEPHEFIS